MILCPRDLGVTRTEICHRKYGKNYANQSRTSEYEERRFKYQGLCRKGKKSCKFTHCCGMQSYFTRAYCFYYPSGLGSDYDSIVSVISAKTKTKPLQEVYALLMSHESRLERNSAINPDGSTPIVQPYISES